MSKSYNKDAFIKYFSPWTQAVNAFLFFYLSFNHKHLYQYSLVLDY